MINIKQACIRAFKQDAASCAHFVVQEINGVGDVRAQLLASRSKSRCKFAWHEWTNFMLASADRCTKCFEFSHTHAADGFKFAFEQVAIQRGAKSIRFRLILDEDAPTGTYDKLVCRLTGELDGQKVTYCVARNTKLVIAAKGQSQKDELGRPLSTLEALRRRNTK